MTTATALLPGISYTQVPKSSEQSALRSDVAGFVGRTKRGPYGVAVRVEGWRQFCAIFGSLDVNFPLHYSIRGYFENGGEVAHVVRIPEPNLLVGRELSTIYETDKSEEKLAGIKELAGLHVFPSSPGAWSTSIRLSIHDTSNSVNWRIEADGEPTESIRYRVGQSGLLNDLDKQRLFTEFIAANSNLIRVRASNGESVLENSISSSGKGRVFEPLQWNSPTAEYLDGFLRGVQAIHDVPEVAIVAMPSLYYDLKDELSTSADSVIDLIVTATRGAAELQDRIILTDVPCRNDFGGNTSLAESFVEELRHRMPSDREQSCIAAYHPKLLVSDPLVRINQPWRYVSPSGHIAGVMSRMDREFGAHHSPANAIVNDAVDLDCSMTEEELADRYSRGINPISCRRGRGLFVWGARTLSLSIENRYVAHRRFLHRLVRAIRQAAEPIVFDTNVPQVWLVLFRAVTTVLMNAYRSGALKGSRPEEAFRVRCDQMTNPRNQIEHGLLSCEIEVALAAPMEFIKLRVQVSSQGRLEVFDS